MSTPFLTVDQVIERALILLRNDDRLKNPPLLDRNGKQIAINRLRDFDGFDDNQSGITLSIYPYTYHGTSNETVSSKNAALVYEDYELGSQNSTARERCKLSLVVSLQTVGYDQDPLTPPVQGQIEIVRSEKERALYRWLTIIWDILLRNPLSNLGGLVHASKVNWGAFHSTVWDGKKGEAVLHKATLLWQLEMYTVRNYQTFLRNVEVPDVGSELSWTYVGVRNNDGTPIYWDSYNNVLMTVLGIPLRFTPKGQPVRWNLATKKFYNPVTDVDLTYSDIEDTSLIPVKEWIDTNLLLVGVLRPSNQNLYWNKSLQILQLFDGTVITTLEDGATPIYYDPETGGIINQPPGTPGATPIDPGTNFLPLTRGQINIYDANTLKLRDSFLFQDDNS